MDKLFTYCLLIVTGGLLLLPHKAATQNSDYPTQAQIDAKYAKLSQLQKDGSPFTPFSITGPEQQCSNAIGICGGVSFSEGNAYSGVGSSDEVVGTCLLSGETNSVWYTFQATTIGTIGFDIIPNNSLDDYDFAVYNITSIGCAGVPSATPIRCNWSGAAGTTGCNPTTTSELPAISVGGAGSKMMNGWQPGTVPQTYVIIIDNWSGSQNGYTLNFTGTATLVDPTPAPSVTGLTYSCTANTINITFDQFIDCGTALTANRLTDYLLTYTPGPTNVTSKLTAQAGFGCVSNRSKEIQLTHDGTLASGPYTLAILSTRAIQDVCDIFVNFPGTQSFNYLGTISMTASVNSICTSGALVTLDANGVDGTPSLATYTLNPGGLTNNTDGIFTVNPIATTTYTVSVTYGGCTKTASQTITLENVAVAITPKDPQICSGTTTLTANATVNGSPCVGCTYLWNTAATTSSITAGSGTYSVVATSSAGCASNSDTSTVTLASGGSTGACMVYYVSPAGGGNGLTKAAPTTLAAALTAAECTAAIIKMQIGNYNLSVFTLVKDFVTIEGGYNVGFTTKTSNLLSGGVATTIRRSNTADVGEATKCTAFKILASSDSWRLQDLRIELPGGGSPVIPAHANGSGVSNYGVRLDGAGSTGYNIIRCYIDAGVGANP